ncbi:MAG: SprT family zinc-dependent metalloprotease [Acidobacteria bacterium]|nr:SprT family zinc-dependent metalloprotease [Acidobacteriota bacterium]
MTDGRRMEVGGISVEVVRKNIRNINLGLYPPDGRVRVSAPLRADDETIRLAIVSRLGWIRRKQSGFLQQERQPERQFVSGESHYVAGRRYRLDLIERDAPPSVRIRNNSWIEMGVRPGSDRAAREAVLHGWYRCRLYDEFPPLVERWADRLGVSVADVRVRRMRTRWGSCNVQARRIWLNSELAKKPPSCLEYVLVHELAHLIERRHNDRFRAVLDLHLPQWRLRKAELERAPLAHEDWRA